MSFGDHSVHLSQNGPYPGNSKTAGRRVKFGAWVAVAFIWNSFILFKYSRSFGGHSVHLSQSACNLKRLAVEQNGVKFRTRGGGAGC